MSKQMLPRGSRYSILDPEAAPLGYPLTCIDLGFGSSTTLFSVWCFIFFRTGYVLLSSLQELWYSIFQYADIPFERSADTVGCGGSSVCCFHVSGHCCSIFGIF
jgi:hypothetical protein